MKSRSRLVAVAKLAGLAVVGTLVMAELVLQIGARLIRDRSGDGWRPGAKVRILAVGDSHTYGTIVPPEESYPAQLQRFLDELYPGVYSVLNLGVPGMSATQVRNRLPIYAKRYDPDLIIVWCGINEAWNRAEQDQQRRGWADILDGAATRIRLYRLVRIWLHDRKLERAAAAAWNHHRQEVRADRPLDPNATMTTRQGEIVERIQHVGGHFRADEVMRQRVFLAFEAMARWSKSRGTPMVLIAYPLEVGGFAVANASIRRVAEKYGLPLVEARDSIKRLPEDKIQFLWAAHPNGAIYGEVARDVASVVVRLRPP